MQILLDDNKISNFSFTQEGMHTLGCQHLNEVFFDIFEIKNKDFQLIKEKKGEVNGKPVVEVDLFIDNVLYKNVQFVLNEHSKTSINKNLLKKLRSSLENKSELVTEQVSTFDTHTLEQQKQQMYESIKRDIVDQIRKDLKLNIDDLLTDNINQNKLQKFFLTENNKFRKDLIELSEKVARRESLRIAESGGGTNAVQYANGGDINGVLNINGNLIVNGQRVVKIVTFLVGDGASTSFTLNHALDNTNIMVNIQDVSSGELVLPYVKIVDNNNIRVDFSFTPDTDSYKVVILG